VAVSEAENQHGGAQDAYRRPDCGNSDAHACIR
jgi:hypothetical protein